MTLPAEYQEVEWIGSTGTQYIDTGVYPKTGIGIVADIKLVSTENERAIFGAKFSSSSYNGSIYWIQWGGDFQFYYANSWSNSTGSRKDTIRHTYEVTSQGKFNLDGVTLWESTSASLQFVGSLPMLIGRTNGLSDGQGANAKFYRFTITENGTTVRDFIPCYRKSDNVIGMYDTVGETFYTNAGTGTFTKGADVDHTIAEALVSLQEDITAARTAITTKGGTVTQGGGSSQLASDIASIPSGDIEEYLKSFTMQYTAFPDSISNISINAPNAECRWDTFRGCSNIPNMNITVKSIDRVIADASMRKNSFITITLTTPPTSLKSFASSDSSANGSTLKLIADLSGVTSYQSFFTGTYGWKKMDFLFDFSSCASTIAVSVFSGNASTAAGLEEIYYKENTLSFSQTVNSDRGLNLIDDSIVSIANGLNETATGQTLTCYSTMKTRCSTLIGTVSLDETETYHVFTEDDSGSTTLQSFITDIKGWSLA